MNNTPIKSHHSLILNRLLQMQGLPHYAPIKAELELAEQTILQLGYEKAALLSKLESITTLINER